ESVDARGLVVTAAAREAVAGLRADAGECARLAFPTVTKIAIRVHGGGAAAPTVRVRAAATRSRSGARPTPDGFTAAVGDARDGPNRGCEQPASTSPRTRAPSRHGPTRS